MAERKVSRFYATNQVMRSELTGRYYFVRKAELLGNGHCRVIGAKVDVTESVEALLKPKKKAKSR